MKLTLTAITILLFPAMLFALEPTEISTTLSGAALHQEYETSNSFLTGVELGSKLRDNLSMDLGLAQMRSMRTSDNMLVTLSMYKIGGRYYPGMDWDRGKRLLLAFGGGLGHFSYADDNNSNKLFLYYGLGWEIDFNNFIITLPRMTLLRLNIRHLFFQGTSNIITGLTDYKKNSITAGLSIVLPLPSGKASLKSAQADDKTEVPKTLFASLETDKKDDKAFTGAAEMSRGETGAGNHAIKQESRLIEFDYCPDSPEGALLDAMGCPLDQDYDGIYDGFDECPDTPAGAETDNRGCLLDEDRDTVPDGIDHCPYTPYGLVVNINGCAKDSDYDTVPNSLDFCPNTPPDTIVDKSGCAQDQDFDGVADTSDMCPNTRFKAKVDRYGCEIFKKKGDKVILEGVNFNFDKYDIRSEGRSILNDVAAVLRNNSVLKVRISGFTDNVGSDSYNLMLSEKRAFAVKNYLLGKGVPGKMMSVAGMGRRNPVSDNNTDAGRAKNRRVELKRVN